MNEIEAAHASVGGTGRGRRYATQQINQAYAVLIASHFQGFCRDLHTESVSLLVEFINPPLPIRHLVQDGFTRGRQLDNKNAQPGSIGSDFGLLGVEFWKKVKDQHPQNEARNRALEELNKWRNAIAHHNFSAVSPHTTPRLTLKKVRSWRSSCRGLARSFDEVMRTHLESLIKSSPWPK